MPGSMPATRQLEWLSSTTAMIVLFWSRATRDLLKSFGWGIAALHRLDAATKLPFPRRPPHSIYRFRGGSARRFVCRFFFAPTFRLAGTNQRRLERLVVSRGTDGSNPVPSTGESGANLILGA